MKRRNRVFVAPLDWGLGHAARCIPIISKLINVGAEVMLGSSGRSLLLLQKEFSDLKSFELPGYNPVYPVGSSMVWKMGFQLPKFLNAISKENGVLDGLIDEHRIDVVISDNRYGFYNRKIKSVLITHQLNILMPPEWKWMEGMVNDFNRRQLSKFDECWLPAPEESLIPLLTKGTCNLKVRNIGHLSRFEKKNLEKKFDVCILCSGPEPQRTVFEKMVEREVRQTKLKYVIVRGNTESEEKISLGDGHCKIYHYLNSDELNEVIEQSEMVISRSGYSTIMDLAILGKNAIFIPTPGQTEQEYIAVELMKRNVAFSMNQDNFNLTTALNESEKYTGFRNFEKDDSLLDAAIQSVI